MRKLASRKCVRFYFQLNFVIEFSRILTYVIWFARTISRCKLDIYYMHLSLAQPNVAVPLFIQTLYYTLSFVRKKSWFRPLYPSLQDTLHISFQFSPGCDATATKYSHVKFAACACARAQCTCARVHARNATLA